MDISGMTYGKIESRRIIDEFDMNWMDKLISKEVSKQFRGIDYGGCVGEIQKF